MKYLYLICVLCSFYTAGNAVTLKLEAHRSHDGTLTPSSNGEIEFVTTGVDPQIVFTPSQQAPAKETAYILAFEYFCPDGVDFVEVFYAANPNKPHWSQDRQIEGGSLQKAEAWQPFAINCQTGSKGKWTPNDTTVRLDFGRRKGLRIHLRNVHFREPTEQEKQSAEAIEARQKAQLKQAQHIDEYLNQKDWPATVTSVTVLENTIEITGTVNPKNARPLHLVEYAPHENPWNLDDGRMVETEPLDTNFKVILPRYTEGKGDRIANRFAVTNKQFHMLLSNALWATDVSGAAERDMPRLRPANHKGLGGVEFKQGIFQNDLNDLGITASTINIELGGLIRPNPKDHIEYIHQGKTWKFNGPLVRRLDDKIKRLTDMDIVNSAILLIGKGAGILVHPEYDSAGIYSMVNLTTQDASDTYRAVISFLAERYSRPDKANGWITHWIIFNEVDYGWTWTNMGEQSMPTYMDAYEKAMRLTYLEARRFNPTAEVFISLTHNWNYNPSDKFRVYPPRNLLDRLALYDHATGAYQWGVAYHPYPQSLLRPRTWEDTKATNSFDTRFITPKNIEVLDAYLHQPQFLYQNELRTVLLSEQGFHTPDYSTASMNDKAAAIAYTWQKILPLETIETFHYHRWVDHPLEGGLKVGLRTLPDEEHPFGLRKEPAFSVLSALETDKAAETIEPYKAIIGIQNWSDVRIAPEK